MLSDLARQVIERPSYTLRILVASTSEKSLTDIPGVSHTQPGRTIGHWWVYAYNASNWPRVVNRIEETEGMTIKQVVDTED